MGEKVSEPSGPHESPFDEELWSKTLAAIRACAGVADAYLSRQTWAPRHKSASLGWFDSGWPNIHTPVLASDSDPVDYSSLFAETVGYLKPLAYRDAPPLLELVDYVEQRQDLRSRLLIPTAKPEHEADFVRMEAAGLALSVLGRARAIGDESEEALLRLFVEREADWLLDPLPVEYWIPLVMTRLAMRGSVRIDDRTRLEELTDGLHLARAPAEYSISPVPSPVACAASHALVLGPYEVPNPGPIRRIFEVQPDPLPLDDIDEFFEALRVVSPVRTGYAQVLRRPLGWAHGWKGALPVIEQRLTVRRYPEPFDDYGWLKRGAVVDDEALGELGAVARALRGAEPRTRLAIRRLSLTDLRTREDDRTVDACIGIEALLGQGRDELTHRISLRAATVLSSRAVNPLDAAEVYELMKAVYKHRSAVVHGSDAARSREVEFRGNSIPTPDLAEGLLRDLIREFLLRPGSWTTETVDAHLLDCLNVADADGRSLPRGEVAQADLPPLTRPPDGTN